ncbi:hypothetical protein, partial [Kitasatospora indigofera]|uniref:hypothetical protein n=1 Tax=Kitasatospora indigofera TaxID=67307 RepID=UPI0036760CC7
NDMIPSKQRATVLSFDSLMASSGGVVVQPVLGRSADLYGYPASLAFAGLIEAIAIPFLIASRRQHAPADVASDSDETAAVPDAAAGGPADAGASDPGPRPDGQP